MVLLLHLDRNQNPEHVSRCESEKRFVKLLNKEAYIEAFYIHKFGLCLSPKSSVIIVDVAYNWWTYIVSTDVR